MFTKLLKLIPYLLVAAVVAITWKSCSDIATLEESVGVYKIEIELLQNSIDSLNSHNTFLEQQADSLLQEISQADTKIDKLNNTLHESRKQAQKNIDAVKSFTVSELEQFFADRYSHIKYSGTY